VLWADSVAAEKGMTEEPYRSEEVLVEGLKAGGQLAQLILVKRYGPRVKYLIKSIRKSFAESWVPRFPGDRAPVVVPRSRPGLLCARCCAAYGPSTIESRPWATRARRRVRSPASPSRESRRLSPKDYAR
jgi:hypothetical protein